MGWRGLFEGWHIVLLIIVVVVVFGWKRLPDAARSMGRSMRIFKSEMGEMKNDGKSPASRDTVRGDVIHDPEQRAETRREQGSGSSTGSTPADGPEQQWRDAAQDDPQHQPHGQQHGA
ncbi:MAG TPA: Sec-independent protein translocase subunit TatA [Segeticoccus sp.]|uniref:Sec-independent protein translocase subunit TatA n=1 Tax=Segeticoccus sp. TaxID=2706531 RepID=UPI002D7F6469|nr:Sec-independent protein translocase subunit TatA [Segeticoccus sp.]HET8598944.1 Sec-independent protein translocase subunit TatA [Segeticoccus sp.]